MTQNRNLSCHFPVNTFSLSLQTIPITTTERRADGYFPGYIPGVSPAAKISMKTYALQLYFPAIRSGEKALVCAESKEDAVRRVEYDSSKIEVVIQFVEESSRYAQNLVIRIEPVIISADELDALYRWKLMKGVCRPKIFKTVTFSDGTQMMVDPTKMYFDYKGIYTMPSWADSRGACIAVVIPAVNKWLSDNIIMMDGSCLDSAASVIAHQVNCKGVMGAGVAKAIRSRYPEIMNEYVSLCNSQKVSRDLLGKCQLVKTNNRQRLVANLFGQDGFGGGLRTDYNALKAAFDSLFEQMDELDLDSVSMPYGIGCGLAGGDWNVVSELLKEAAAIYDMRIHVELWKI